MKNTNYTNGSDESESPMPSSSRHMPRNRQKELETELSDLYVKFFDADAQLKKTTQKLGEDSQEAKEQRANILGLQMQLDITRKGLKHLLKDDINNVQF